MLWTGDVPAVLNSVGFRALWAEWLAFRAEEKREPVTQRSGDMSLEALAEMGPARACAAIRHTIANGWQGIREPDQGRRPTAEGVGEKLARELREQGIELT
jgi:hypothetical protein